MIFRHKLLILLLVIALVPLLINGLLHRTTIRQISQQLTTQTREALQENSTRQLQTLVEHQSLLLDRDRAFTMQALNAQVREIEHGLNSPQMPTDLSPSYLSVQQQRTELFIWQATILESEQTSLFPAEATAPSKESTWYQGAERDQDLYWQLALVDSQLQFIAAKPVYYKNSEFAGVTAFALNYQQLFKDWQLPEPWNEQGRLFVVKLGPLPPEKIDNFISTIEVISPSADQVTALTTQQLFNKIATTTDFSTLIHQMRHNRSGIQILDFDSQQSIWIYAGATTELAFPLLIIPRHLVTLPAQQASDYVESQFIQGLKQTGLLSVAVLVWVIITAFFRSRSVTTPLAQLSGAAEQLSKGDYTTQVHIHSNDEFSELGSAFNRIGPQLKERQQIKQSLAIAKDIQQLILPTQTPQLDNFDLAFTLDYCDETGGDYYDFIQTDSGKWGLVVGDVVGHGIGSALLMSSAAGIMHSAIANGEENLSNMFSSLNRFLERDVGDSRLMTLFAALLDPAEQTIDWLSAGHGPIFLYRAESRSVEELPATTMPLGVMADVDFEPIHRETMNSGDILAIGTDGIWETINTKGDMFGAERVSQLLHELANQSAEEITSQLLYTVETFRGGAAKEDDVTLIILKAK